MIDGDTIPPINCSGVVHGISGVLCEACKSYRHSLLAMLSKERCLSTLSKHEPPMTSRTQVNSHCPWKRLYRNVGSGQEIVPLNGRKAQRKLPCWKGS